MERVKLALSDVVHNWTVIGMVILFLFTVNPGPTKSEAVVVKPQKVKTVAQIKKETLERYSKTVYKPSDSLTGLQLKELLSTVGFEGKALKTAWAIAMRESNGRPKAYNGNRKTGDSSYGIFQINMLGQLGIDRMKKFNLVSNKQLFDPVKNAEITYYMSKHGSDWHSWKGLNPAAKKWLKYFPE